MRKLMILLLILTARLGMAQPVAAQAVTEPLVIAVATEDPIVTALVQVALSPLPNSRMEVVPSNPTPDQVEEALGRLAAAMLIWTHSDAEGTTVFVVLRPRYAKTDFRTADLDVRDFALRLGTDTEPARQLLSGFFYYLAGDYANAVSSFEAASLGVALGLPQDITYFYLGKSRFYGGDPLAGFDHMNQALTANNEMVIAYHLRGLISYTLGDWEGALIDYNLTLSLEPYRATALSDRGLVFYALGLYNVALSDYNRALQLRPDLLSAYNGRGMTYYALGAVDLALADYTLALALDPENADAYNNRGNYYADQGQSEAAIADYTRAIAIRPDFADAYTNRAILYFTLQNYAQAILDATKAIEINPQDAKAYWIRGSAYYEVGDFNAAAADYRQYEAIMGYLEPIMQEQLAEIEGQ